MCPIVPTFTCGLVRSNFSLAMLFLFRSVPTPPKLWSGRRESNPRPTAWKAVTLPLSYSRSNCPAFSISEVLRCAQNLGCGLPPADRLDLEGCDSTTELLPPALPLHSREILRSAQDFGCGLPLCSRPQNASSYSRENQLSAISCQLSVRPQRLKPLFFATLNGMAEAMP